MKNKFVSIWAGLASSREQYEDYIGERYSEDGDFIPSPFVEEIGLSWIDHDNQESEWFENHTRFADAIINFSYAHVYAPLAMEKAREMAVIECNFLIILFDYKPVSHAAPSNFLNFIGTFDIT